MKAREIRNNVYLLGAVDWDRRLFDALIPLPQGTSYNAYLVKGSEKTALLDTVDPAHLGDAARPARGACPGSTTWCPPRRAGPLRQHCRWCWSGTPTPSRHQRALQGELDRPPARARRPLQVVEDGDTLSLGNKTLKFVFTPWVHWPETMSTWLKEDKVLFSCDFFGSHLATTDLFAGHAVVHGPAKRYYAEIMMPFAAQVAEERRQGRRSTRSTSSRPATGPLYEKPKLIIDAYREWAGGEPKNLVVAAVRVACTTARG